VDNIMSSKLFTTRQGTVLLGVIAAVIAAVALIVYLNHYRSSVKTGTEPISVLVAQKLIQQGTTGEVIRTTPGLYKSTSFPKDQVENGAILDPATLAGKVATTEISPGQQLKASDFSTTGTSIVSGLKQDQRAVVLHLDSPNQVGGQIQAGSHVDVWVSFNGQGSNGVARPIVRELYQDMTVLEVAKSGGNVTLQATSAQAGALIFASENATPWLVLRPTVGSTDRKPPTIGVSQLLGSGSLRTGG
jgi:Flp pilus assembly protein CpaB